MTFFWDKNLAKTIPQAIRMLKPPFGTEIYLEHFPLSDQYREGGDDVWLPFVGSNGWFVITQDYNLHVHLNELRAIQQYNIGVFYLWGATAPKWDVMRLFVRSSDRIIQRALTTPRPFIYRVYKSGSLYPVAIH